MMTTGTQSSYYTVHVDAGMLIREVAQAMDRSHFTIRKLLVKTRAMLVHTGSVLHASSGRPRRRIALQQEQIAGRFGPARKSHDGIREIGKAVFLALRYSVAAPVARKCSFQRMMGHTTDSLEAESMATRHFQRRKLVPPF